MMIKRIFAGSIVALLLTVSSLAASCDLSCTFAQRQSDCHSQEAQSQSSADSSMQMKDMPMTGMSMPEAVNREHQQEDQQTVNGMPVARVGHPTIGEMGPCERQFCSDAYTFSVKSSNSCATQFHSTLAVAESPCANSVLQFIRGARDDIAFDRELYNSPLHLSLRI
jgi:hypothetical protein